MFPCNRLVHPSKHVTSISSWIMCMELNWSRNSARSTSSQSNQKGVEQSGLADLRERGCNISSVCIERYYQGNIWMAHSSSSVLVRRYSIDFRRVLLTSGYCSTAIWRKSSKKVNLQRKCCEVWIYEFTHCASYDSAPCTYFSRLLHSAAIKTSSRTETSVIARAT